MIQSPLVCPALIINLPLSMDIIGCGVISVPLQDRIKCRQYAVEGSPGIVEGAIQPVDFHEVDELGGVGA